jgi:FMN-dependent oxidoreductase (nitrilotriacetate monooxygenase family)
MASEMSLNLLLRGAGMHEAAWRHARSSPSVVWDGAHYSAMAQIAERGKFDAVFITDELASPAGQGGDDAAGRLEPITLLALIAGATERIGLVATASTSFTEPYNLARMFATLDHISKGRAGWNVVTSAADRAAQNFGLDEIDDHDLRYEKAAEYVELVRRLWDSWEPDAVIADRDSPNYVNLDKIHEVNFVGRFYRSRGPLNIPRMPQGHPVLFQAGSSPAGIDLAASIADAVFTVQQSIEDGRAFVDQVRASARLHGRDPRNVKVFPGIVPFIGSTHAEASQLKEELDALADVSRSIRDFSVMLGVDLTGADLDAPTPNLDGTRNDARANAVRALGRRPGMTLRKLVQEAGASRGHRVLIGSPEEIADDLQAWFSGGAADGFTVAPPILPYALDLFVDHVVPILQARGLFRSDYRGATLRDHLAVAPSEIRTPLPAGR